MSEKVKKWVYSFDEIDEAEKYVDGKWDDVRGLLGGKGANLAEMHRLKLPVPPGFTVTTEACNAYIKANGVFPEGLWEQVMDALEKMEAQTGKKFGDENNPLLVSCRSGAKFSMPGMMDTILNIGLNDRTKEGMMEFTQNRRFVLDSYRRFIQMYGNVVRNVPDDAFEEALSKIKAGVNAKTDAELTDLDLERVIAKFKALFNRYAGTDFSYGPDGKLIEPNYHLRRAIEAVFKSWNGKRAVDYRNASGISHDLGTAVSIVAMVFGNTGDDSATGVAMTRNGATGEKQIEGDYLINAQGEDVVAGIRQTKDISQLKIDMPQAYIELERIANILEKHYKNMQDVEFTIEKGKLWMLQTRDGKRTAGAAVRIAVDMVEESLITKKEAVLRITPEQVDFFLHPQFNKESISRAKYNGELLARGLNVSPGAACGMVALDADLAEMWGKKENKPVIMVRMETKPDDIHGMLVAQGILTSRGGRTSHAALVARQFGKPAVVGVSDLKIDMMKRQISFKNTIIKEGDFISIDGTSGEVYAGKVPTIIPDIKDERLIKLLSWADGFRKLGVYANADYPHDAKRARDYGAEGIGLCRTEHMFFEKSRLPLFRKMIMADLPVEQYQALSELLPFQREDFLGLFKAMDGLPVIIRLIDPPLHEFLPNQPELIKTLADLKIRIKHARNLKDIDELIQEIRANEKILKRAESLCESNPMLGLRGVRLGIKIPDLTKMQVRAIFEAACIAEKEGVKVFPKIMIPFTSHANELKIQREVLEKEARLVMQEQDTEIPYKFGTMIELPRAALTADKIAQYASFMSFGTNDLTQTTFGISRDDAEASFLVEYLESSIFPDNPFATIDKDGVGELMKIAIERGRSVKPELECGICGEHGGEPQSIHFCHKIGLNYVSCSPFRVPVARLAAAHIALNNTLSLNGNKN